MQNLHYVTHMHPKAKYVVSCNYVIFRSRSEGQLCEEFWKTVWCLHEACKVLWEAWKPSFHTTSCCTVSCVGSQNQQRSSFNSYRAVIENITVLKVILESNWWVKIVKALRWQQVVNTDTSQLLRAHISSELFILSDGLWPFTTNILCPNHNQGLKQTHRELYYH